MTLGEFNTISFALPSDIQAKLGTSGYSDLQIKLVLNLPYNATGPDILDKLTSGQYEDPDGPVPEPDTPTEVPVAGFEEPLKWEGEGAELALDSENAALGESALAVQTQGNAAWFSAPLSTISGVAPDNNRISFLVKLPAATSARLAVFLDAASLGLNKAEVAAVPLAGYVAGSYHAFSFKLSENVVSRLATSTYDDLSIRFELTGAPAGTYYFDDLSIGNLNRRPYDHLAEGDDFEEPEANPLLDSAGSLPSTFRQSPAVKFPGKPQGPG